MKVSYQWLSEYVNVSDLTAEEIAEKMSRTGIEVDGVLQPGAGLQKIVVGETLEVVDHPDSDHLHVCQVNVGEEEPIQIVCGAPNVAAGQKVIVALHGARIAGNHKIKKGKIRGQVSNGMICSLEELGFPENVIPKKYADGIFVLPNASEVGMDVVELLNLNDSVLELDITPNRADALSMHGVAHEIGAIYDKSVSLPEVPVLSEEATNDLDVRVADSTDAPAYHIQLIKDVTIKESPLWLQTKLMKAGMRPVNNVVDVTNYILLEYGQPLHAFDYDQIGSKEIFVRRANDGETMNTLDGTKRTLDASDIVITNGTEPIALAGVMGGLESEITEQTTNVALEFAMFNPLSIRKTGAKYNLRSESSARFEKGINAGTIEKAGHHAAALILELGEGSSVSNTNSGSSVDAKNEEVSITLSRINGTLGTDLSMEQVLGIFKQLEFGTTVTDETITVSVPPRRWDIHIEADLVEEVARIYGYNNLPTTLPTTAATVGALTKRQKAIRMSRTYLEAAGLSQALTYVLTTDHKARAYTTSTDEPIRLAWPMSEERSTLRQNLIASLLDVAQYNASRKNATLGFYELGKVFFHQDGEPLPLEEEHIGGLIVGNREDASWQVKEEAVDFFTMKGIVEGYFAECGITNHIRYEAIQTLNWMHPGQTAGIYLNDQLIGYVGQIHPAVAKEYDLKAVFAFELSFDAVQKVELEERSQRTIPKYPGISRDIAVLVDQSVTNEQIESIMKREAGDYMTGVSIFDIYTGQGVPEGSKSMAYSISFLNPQATLVEEDVQPAMKNITEALRSELGATIR